MNIQPPQALAGFLLAKAHVYPNAIGVPGWLVEVLQQQLARPLPPALAVASALLRPEYTREYIVKRMRLPSADELQGFLDLPVLVIAVGEAYLDPEHSRLEGQPEFQALPASQQEQARQFVDGHLAWAMSVFQPGHLQDGTPLMAKIYRQVRGEPFSVDYLHGSLAAQDTFCLHNDFIRSFALGRNPNSS
jgi:hypothetical protein